MSGFNPVPKPAADKPKKKKQNGYKDKPNRRCFYDGDPAAERHEVFGGNPNRQHSIEDGFQVDVCTRHHKELQANITEWAQKENKFWREFYQRKYEIQKIGEGMTPLEARIAFRERYGKSYLPILEEEK
jgi:hypothetical protein